MESAKALQTINSYWFDTPWIPYHLHWDDRQHWPDPWQLLEDNLYCPLARALGIVYTIALLDRNDLQNIVVAECGNDNLVLVEDGKYILNWDRDSIVNISHDAPKPQRTISLSQIQQQIR